VPRHPATGAYPSARTRCRHGSQWFVEQPTIPLERIAANINLDQLRPIFPLELMTVHARTDTSLGLDAAAIADARGIR
jgi:hypothetical protein